MSCWGPWRAMSLPLSAPEGALREMRGGPPRRGWASPEPARPLPKPPQELMAAPGPTGLTAKLPGQRHKPRNMIPRPPPVQMTARHGVPRRANASPSWPRRFCVEQGAHCHLAVTRTNTDLGKQSPPGCGLAGAHHPAGPAPSCRHPWPRADSLIPHNNPITLKSVCLERRSHKHT